MECQFCSNTYDRSKRQPLVVSPCSHTFCLSCLENPDIKSCKTCSSVIKEKNTNWALLELIPASEYDTLKLKVENHLKEVENEKNILKETKSNKFKEYFSKFPNFKSQIDARVSKLIKTINENKARLLNDVVLLEEKLNQDQNQIFIDQDLKESKLNEIKSKLKSTFPNETELNSMTEELSQIQSDMNQYKSFDEYNLVLNNKILNEANLIGALELQDTK